MSAIIGSRFCNANPTDIGVVMSVLRVGDNRFFVTDIDGNVIFRVRDTSSIIRNQRTLFDSNDTPIVTFRPKRMSAHRRWIAYRGDSTSKKDIIFGAKQSEKNLKIYLHDNDDEDKYDFKVDSKFIFYKGHSKKIIIAEPMDHTVKMRENVDSAFIVSLIVILDAMSDQESKNGGIGSSLIEEGSNVISDIVGI